MEATNVWFSWRSFIASYCIWSLSYWMYVHHVFIMFSSCLHQHHTCFGTWSRSSCGPGQPFGKCPSQRVKMSWLRVSKVPDLSDMGSMGWCVPKLRPPFVAELQPSEMPKRRVYCQNHERSRNVFTVRQQLSLTRSFWFFASESKCTLPELQNYRTSTGLVVTSWI